MCCVRKCEILSVNAGVLWAGLHLSQGDYLIHWRLVCRLCVLTIELVSCQFSGEVTDASLCAMSWCRVTAKHLSQCNYLCLYAVVVGWLPLLQMSFGFPASFYKEISRLVVLLCQCERKSSSLFTNTCNSRHRHEMQTEKFSAVVFACVKSVDLLQQAPSKVLFIVMILCCDAASVRREIDRCMFAEEFVMLW